MYIWWYFIILNGAIINYLIQIQLLPPIIKTHNDNIENLLILSNINTMKYLYTIRIQRYVINKWMDKIRTLNKLST